MQASYLQHLVLAWVYDAHILVTTRSADKAAIAVPRNTKDQVWVHVRVLLEDCLARGHIPDVDEVVTA